MSADEARPLAVQQPAPGPQPGASRSASPPPSAATGGEPDGKSADDELRALARKAAGLVIGLVLLIGCGFAVSHLNAWGERWTMPLVFVVFVLVMMLASNLVVGGASAVWNAARSGAR
ncbi:hypothetical protein [Tsukamurella pseudospumae]|uniref:Uncharacterized protein n=1 Tax=Tsukamurella pseudospumae TaxID=239498 RepID=A0A138ABJ3_9ACTN|nr:hypothetical protein [Tsukamurella pseudospumae]KXP07871.1 hypothetical protein AXK60_09650 [Tsukamurella pseudospumae]